MNKKNILPLLLNVVLIALLFGCDEKKHASEQAEQQTEKLAAAKAVKNKVSVKNNLFGIWSIDENPIFEITTDSIYYIDHDKSYRYTINKDSMLTIYYDDFIYNGTVSFKNEKTLVIKDSTATTIYYREEE